MDVFTVQAAARQALDYVRQGNGPYILEMMTYRYRGHSMSDPAKYRSKDEVSEMKENRDPIETLKAQIIKQHNVAEEDLKALDKKIKVRVKEAADFAQESPELPPEELWTDVLIDTETNSLTNS